MGHRPGFGPGEGKTEDITEDWPMRAQGTDSRKQLISRVGLTLFRLGAFFLILIALFLSFISSSPSAPFLGPLTASAQAAEATDHPSWASVVSLISSDLDQSAKAYQKRDPASAQAAAQKAYNGDYMGSNMSRAVKQVQGGTESGRQIGSFTAIINLTYQPADGKRSADLKAAISRLESSLTSSASALDADRSLGSPREYGKALEAATRAERKKIEEKSTIKNEGKGSRTWSSIAQEMNALLDKAFDQAIRQGDGEAGAGLVNDAYYKYYEKLGFEKTVMSVISGSRVSAVEYQFKQTRKDMVAGKGRAVIRKDVDALKSMLSTDAAILDKGGTGDQGNPVATFFTRFFSSAFGQAFIILIREGLEAILVVAAIIAYLVKAGQRNKLGWIYLGIVAGLAASALMAVILNLLYGASGSNQELIEGITALIAMVMLLYTSNWMLNKSSTSSWDSYIKRQTKQGITSGSILSLASLSFLAVFREGAETVLFYQALVGMVSNGDHSALYGGAGLATVILVIVFLLIRFTSVKIPLRPFFAITSTMMAVMVVIFAGGGLHELIEADLVDGHYLASWITNDFLGIYPYAETVAFQVVMGVVVLLLMGFSVAQRRSRDRLKAAERPAEGRIGKSGKARADIRRADQAEEPGEETSILHP